VTPVPPVCLTGASGFIGQRVVERLRALGAKDVALLVRNASRVTLLASQSNWRVVELDFATGPIPPHAISADAVVLHLAAATGNSDPRTLQRVNVDATARLVEAAHAADAKHIVFVSSIAAGYRDKRWAPYAESKLAAEHVVARAGIPHTIVRPTMVFGPGSPNQRALERLATLVRPVLAGHGHVRVQPIHVDDLASALVQLVITPPPVTSPAPVTIGGPNVVTMRELFAAIRRARGLPPRDPVSLPLEAVRRTLAILGAATASRLPVSAGQFVAFANDSVADPQADGVHLPAARISLEAMLGSPAGDRQS
jgi:nucleoside-diphosphate-sugar epimerase